MLSHCKLPALQLLTLLLLIAASLGCAIHRKPKVQQSSGQYDSKWKCESQAIDAKTGKPTVFTCTDDEGNLWTAKKANR
jgi:hypothetical protein